MVKKMIRWQWIVTTLLVLAGVALMVRLGIWQLDRLHQRRAFNSRVTAQIEQPTLDLSGDTVVEGLGSMEYRDVVVRGEYDHSQEVVLRNQIWNDQAGVHLLTPLLISGSDQAVLVDRGWIPLDAYQAGDWSEFAEPGIIEVRGVIRASQSEPEIGSREDPVPGLEDWYPAWHFANVESIDKQISLSLLPVYIQQSPDPSWQTLPYRSEPELELTEGPHLGYAIQWFTFATILAVGYPFYVRKEIKVEGEDKAYTSPQPTRHTA
jgi:surfeit locus 1 family protein